MKMLAPRRLVWVLAGAFVLVGMGLWGYAHALQSLRYDVFPFDGLLTIVPALVWSRLMVTPTETGFVFTRDLKKWLWMLLPFVASATLFLGAGYSARELTERPAVDIVRQYALFVASFLTVLLIWTIFAPISFERPRTRWRQAFLAIGAIIAICVFALTFRFAYSVNGSPPMEGFYALQRQLLVLALAIYLLLVARLLAPLTIRQLRVFDDTPATGMSQSIT